MRARNNLSVSRVTRQPRALPSPPIHDYNFSYTTVLPTCSVLGRRGDALHATPSPTFSDVFELAIIGKTRRRQRPRRPRHTRDTITPQYRITRAIR